MLTQEQKRAIDAHRSRHSDGRSFRVTGSPRCTLGDRGNRTARPCAVHIMGEKLVAFRDSEDASA